MSFMFLIFTHDFGRNSAIISMVTHVSRFRVCILFVFHLINFTLIQNFLHRHSCFEMNICFEQGFNMSRLIVMHVSCH
jgi:hypothetical protein